MKINSEFMGEARALDTLVNRFAEVMRRKLMRKLSTGYSGWDDPDWTEASIRAAMIEHVEKGDPVDIANFAAFLWNRAPERAGRNGGEK